MATRERHGDRAEAASGKFLTFELDGETYGVGIRSVREIMGIIDITPVPDAPAHVRGVVNLRGKIVPVVDLRRRLGIGGAQPSSRSCIVVVETPAAGERSQAGMIVDSVSEVVPIPETDIEPPPEIGGAVQAGSVEGLAKVREKVVILLSIERTLAGVGDVTAA